MCTNGLHHTNRFGFGVEELGNKANEKKLENDKYHIKASLPVLKGVEAQHNNTL
ncbi:Uncharacterized protein NCS13_1_1753 [Neochlamydia sp. S13]|nr:Uncharacterized protein NCS13_1_1753 [Neochlamydia sp. S13]